MVEEQTEYDTIAAISTPPGEGAISIVRLSGDDALPIVMKMFKGKDLTKVSTHTINYGHIIDPKNGANFGHNFVVLFFSNMSFRALG